MIPIAGSSVSPLLLIAFRPIDAPVYFRESLLRSASSRDETLSRAAAHAVLIKTAGGFTGAVEAGNDLAV